MKHLSQEREHSVDHVRYAGIAVGLYRARCFQAKQLQPAEGWLFFSGLVHILRYRLQADESFVQDASYILDGGSVHTVIVPEANAQLVCYCLWIESLHVTQHHETVAAPLGGKRRGLWSWVQVPNRIQENAV